MKKIVIISSVLVCLFVGTNSLAAREFIFFFGGNLTGGFSMRDSDYTRNPGYNFVDSSDSGTIASQLSSPPIGVSFGIGYFFSRQLGVAVSMNFPGKAAVDLTSNYTFAWQFPGKSQHSNSAAWTSPGDISIRPINLNLVYAHYFRRNTLINLTAGASLFRTKVNLLTHIGYGAGGQYVYYRFVDPHFERVTISLVDWYELEVKNVQQKTVFGVNVGFNIEQRFTGNLSVFAGFCYYFAPKETYTWELTPAAEYEGYFGALSRTLRQDRSNLPDISHVTTGIKLSHFSVVMGVKVRFWKKGRH
jgi:hypothetical protein